MIVGETRFIVIEGLDGAGKQTAATATADVFKKAGVTAEVVSFPMYDKWHSIFVRRYLNKSKKNLMPSDPFAASIAYAFDRFIWNLKFRFRRDKPQWIIFDRYTTSSIVYQGARAQNKEELKRIIDFIVKLEWKILRLPVPNIVIVLNPGVDQARKNMESREVLDDHEMDDNLQETAQRMLEECANCYGWWHLNTINPETGMMYRPETIGAWIMTAAYVQHHIQHIDTRKLRLAPPQETPEGMELDYSALRLDITMNATFDIKNQESERDHHE